MRRPTPDIEPVMVTARDIALSGLLARATEENAKGVILALHGGGYSAGYWRYEDERCSSLLTLAAGLGFHVLALDRPGYGASEKHDPRRLGLADQVDYLFDALYAWCAENCFAGPAFVIGHSLGGIVSLLMAAHARGSRLAGVDVLGVPFRFPDNEAGAKVHSWPTDGTHVPPPDAEARRWLMFGPDWTHDAAAIGHDATVVRPMPVAEYRDALTLPSAWQTILPTISVPVQFTLAEFEIMQATGWSILREVEALLGSSAHPVVHLQKSSGHNASCHKIARAYHLRAIAFFEECLTLLRRY
jgi:pimeloyl-ACP methyl ester carboxylesterase